MDSTTLKAQINSEITNETAPNSISPADVGGNMTDIVDYVDQQAPVKTVGNVEADNVSEYQILQYDLNMVNTTGASDKVVLPDTGVVGKEILVFALNNGAAFSVRGDQAGSAVLSPNGVASQSTSVSIAANISYRFIHLGNGFWKAELI